MKQKREQWDSKFGFILAAIGSAVGLGNIWRFPYVVYSSGGGAFFIPYFCAIFTAGIPLLILEYSVGHKYKGSTPKCMQSMGKKFEWAGWWPIISSFAILCYYSMILGWAIKYATMSFSKPWGDDANDFFYNDFLSISPSPTSFSKIVVPILIGILVVWVINWIVCYNGVKKGIEKASKILLPTLFAIMFFIVIKSVTMDGAVAGLNVLFAPDWSALKNPDIWISAYGQVFFSLSIGTGIMMTYSSYLPEKTDINNTAFMTAFANCGFEFLSAIGVFAILGVMATMQNVPVNDVVSSGIGLAFIAFPNIFTRMGMWGSIIGFLFFVCLVFAGITSSVSLTEAISAAIGEKFDISRKKVVSLLTIIGFTISIVFATDASLYILDIMDNFINNYGIVTVGLIEALIVGWYVKPDTIRNHANEISYFRVGSWWNIIIKYITPVMLTVTVVQSVIKEINHPYGDYARFPIMLYGWSIIAVGIVGAIIISKIKWKSDVIDIPSKANTLESVKPVTNKIN